MTNDVILKFIGWTDKDKQPSQAWLDWAKNEFNYFWRSDDDDENHSIVMRLLCRAWRVWNISQENPYSLQTKDNAIQTCRDALGLACLGFQARESLFHKIDSCDVLEDAVQSGYISKQSKSEKDTCYCLTPTGLLLAEKTGIHMPDFLPLSVRHRNNNLELLKPVDAHENGRYRSGDHYFLDGRLVLKNTVDYSLTFSADLGVFTENQATAFEEFLVEHLYKISKAFRVPEWLQERHLWIDVNLDESSVSEKETSNMKSALLNAPEGTIDYNNLNYSLYALSLTSLKDLRYGEPGIYGEHVIRSRMCEHPEEWAFAAIAMEYADITRKNFPEPKDRPNPKNSSDRPRPPQLPSSDSDITFDEENECPDKKRNAYVRDHLFLAWFEGEELSKKEIRDLWNSLNTDVRNLLCPRCSGTIDFTNKNIPSTIKAIKNAKKERIEKLSPGES